MVTHQPAGRARAQRLAPEERRAALLAVATQLFIERGSAFTTADLAEAAGVSEGTIFRYFPDKASLVDASRQCALGLDTLVPELVEAAELATLDDRLLVAARALAQRIAQMAQVAGQHEHHHGPDGHGGGPELIAPIIDALVPLFDTPDHEAGEAGEISVALDTSISPRQLANIFIGCLFSNTVMCEKTDTPPLSVEHLVAMFLRGARVG